MGQTFVKFLPNIILNLMVEKLSRVILLKQRSQVWEYVKSGPNYFWAVSVEAEAVFYMGILINCLSFFFVG